MIFSPLATLLNQCPDARLAAGLRFLQQIPADIATGRHELEGRAYAMVDAYDTVDETAHPFEAHRQFIDIHMMLEGVETIQYAPLAWMQDHTPYNPEDDYALFTAKAGADVQSLVVAQGICAVFYPDDAHKPGLIFKNAASVKKVVVKLPVSQA